MIRLESGLFSVRIKLLPWDSDVLGIKCGVIEIYMNSSGPKASNLTQLLGLALDKARSRKFRFLTAKISNDEQGVANACFSNKGLLIDTELTFSKESERGVSLCPEFKDDFFMKRLRRYWHRSLFKVADSLTFSRFRSDPNIENAAAVSLWRKSVYNNCNGRASYSIICFKGKNPIGVMNVFEKSGVSSIFLVGLINSYQGLGLGSDMVKFYEYKLSKSIKTQVVQTSLLNYRAQNLYLKAGYKIKASRHIIHYWL